MFYTVQRNDSPARIAAKLTGNGANMHALIAANRHKPMMTVGGHTTFRSLSIGERLNVPPGWRGYGGGATPQGKPPPPVPGQWPVPGFPKHQPPPSPHHLQGVPDGYGLGFGLGQTSDTNLLNAATAVTNENLNWGGNCPVDSVVQSFQTAWNNTSDSNMAQATDSHGNVIGQLTADGKYGQETADAVQAALGSLSPTPCTSFGGGGGGGGYSAAVVAAATALDAYLNANGCTNCQAIGSPPVAGDPLSTLVSAFKQSILVTASDWGSNPAAATVTGHTINVQDPACQISFGSETGGTLADMRAVLGGAATYAGTYCTNSGCSCTQTGGGAPPGPPPDSSCGPNQIIDASTWQCANLCPDDSRPCNGNCIGYSGAPMVPQNSPCPAPPSTCTAPQVKDTVTGQCANPCWDGSAPANAVCPPQPGCTAPQVKDTVTGTCVAPCWDGSSPAGAVCPPKPVKQCTPPQVLVGGQCVNPPAQASSSSGAGALVAGVLILGVGGAATYYALQKKKRHAHA